MNDAARKNPFPPPAGIQGVPGAAGCERMYPYYTGRRLRVDGDRGIVTILE